MRSVGPVIVVVRFQTYTRSTHSAVRARPRAVGRIGSDAAIGRVDQVERLSGQLRQAAHGEAEGVTSRQRALLGWSRAGWPPLLFLVVGIASIVASEFLPASVLPELSRSLGVPEGTAGLAVAATAIAAAVTAPTIAVVLPRADRRTVLVALLLAAAVSNVAVAVTPGFTVLLLARVLLGVAIAGYWSFAFGAGVRAMPQRDHIVSSALAFGVSLATVVGVPLASAAAAAVGWRIVFIASGALAVLAALTVALTLPSVPADPAAGLVMLAQALRSRRLMFGAGLVALVVLGNFLAYPYIRTAIAAVAPLEPSWFLLAWGIGGVAGSLAAGRLAHRLRGLAVGASLALGAGLAGTAVASAWPILLAAIVLWGLPFNALPVATQLWMARIAPTHVESALSLQVMAFQVAITTGSASGGALLDSYGVEAALAGGAIAAAIAGLGSAASRSPSQS